MLKTLAKATLPVVVLLTSLFVANGQRAHALTIGSGSGDALDPRNPSFGAIANDGIDDRAALQKWINAGCRSRKKLLYLPPGDWHVTRRDIPSEIGSLVIPAKCDGLTMLGSGRASRIVMLGTGIPKDKPIPTPSDWWVFDIRGQRITIDGIAIDGARRKNTIEQTHLIQLSEGARDIELRRLYVNLPVLQQPTGLKKCRPSKDEVDFETRMCAIPGVGEPVKCNTVEGSARCTVSAEGIFNVIGWFGGGDCIRSLGTAERAVDGVSISENYALACDRSFIGFQRYSRNFTITGNMTKLVADQVIDQEPTGQGDIGKIVITNNRFERGSGNKGQFAISLSGTGPNAEMGDAMIVSNNILDGGIRTFNVSRISIEHNVINGNPANERAEGVIDIVKHTDSVRVIGNDIHRPRASANGPVIRARTHNSGSPREITIALNTIKQYTNSHVINLEGVQGVTISDNTIECHQTTATEFSAIFGKSVPAREDDLDTTDENESRPAVPIERLVIAGNRARGSCADFARLASGDDPPIPVGAITIVGNQTRGFNFGVVFKSANPTVKPRVSDNLFEGILNSTDFVSGPPGFAFDGENGPMP
jgi:hypothetical protein